MFVPNFKWKPMPPETLASGLVQKHGQHKAAKITQHEAREFHGTDKSLSVNTFRDYYTAAHKWIMKRYPKALEV